MATTTILACTSCGTKNKVDEQRVNLAVCGHCGAPLAHQQSGRPLEVTDANFEREVLGAGGRPVLVDCWASWCPPCRMLAPIIDEIARDAAGRFIVGKLNTEENPGIASQFQVNAIPTMLIFKDGELVDQIVGLAPKQEILNVLERHV